MTYLSVNEYLKKQFGTKVYKLSLSSGCSCPNRDGKSGYNGCAFCSAGGSGEFASGFAAIKEQIAEAKKRVDAKFPRKISTDKRKYIAYFQSYTNTYGDRDRLEKLFREALQEEEVVALSLGTRPDCLGPDMVDMISSLNKIKPVWVELGLQTVNDDVAAKINRCYPLSVFEDAYARLKAQKISVIVHVILGLPWESECDMLKTVSYLAGLKPALDGIKLQNLQIIRGTEIFRMYTEHPFHVFSLEEYCALIVKCLRILPEDMVIHRITGDGPKKLLEAPLWSADKKRVMNTMKDFIAKAER